MKQETYKLRSHVFGWAVKADREGRFDETYDHVNLLVPVLIRPGESVTVTGIYGERLYSTKHAVVEVRDRAGFSSGHYIVKWEDVAKACT